MIIGLFTASVILLTVLVVGICGYWLYDSGYDRGYGECGRLSHDDDGALVRSHNAELKQLAIDFDVTLNVLRDQHDQELADLRQRCAEYVSERLRLDRSSGIEFPLTNIECGINQLPLRADNRDA